MINRHTTFFVNEIKPVEFCGKSVIWQVELNGAFELPFEVEPTKGEHNYTTCEGCQKNLEALTKRLTVKFEGNQQKKGFPYCCSYHSKLRNVKEFDRALFVNVPVLVAKKIIYTNQHITNNHSSENWYKLITDYIDWTVESFGQMPQDCGEPLFLTDFFFFVTDSLKRNEEMKAETKARLLEFLNKYQTPNESTKTDLNVLLSTYQSWFKIFPFELNSYFGNLKQHFEKQLPILNGKAEINIYSGTAKFKMHTKGSLIEALINLTNNILTQINGVTLYEKGLLTDANKIKLELVINRRKLKLKQGYKNSSPNEEQRYRKILKEWFKDEKIFIDEITPLLKALPPQQAETEQATPTFTNNFDRVNPTEIYKHFKAGLVDKQYLTEHELNDYLKVAFELKIIPETLFKINDAPKKEAIEAVFYNYYKNVAGKIHGKQKQYAALLGDYFEGYKTTTVSSNFSKSVY